MNDISKELDVIFKVISKLESIDKQLDSEILEKMKELCLLLEMEDGLRRVKAEYEDNLRLVGRIYVLADILDEIRIRKE